MNKWRKCNWYFLLSLCLYTFSLTSCSAIKLRSLIPSLANDQTQNKIEKSLLDEKLRNKDKEITELRASLNTLNELKTKVNALKKDLFNFRFRKINGPIEDTSKVLQLKNVNHKYFSPKQKKSLKDKSVPV